MNQQQKTELFLQGPNAWNEWSESITNSKPQITDKTQLEEWKNKAKTVIVNERFSEELDLAAYVIPGEIEFNYCQFNDQVYGRTAHIGDGGHVSFVDSLFRGNVEFEGVNFHNQILFQNCTFNQATKLSSCSFSQACFDNSRFLGELELDDTEFHIAARFRVLYCEGDAHFRQCVFPSRAEFTNSKFSRGANFTGTGLRRATFKNSILEKSLFNRSFLAGADFSGCSLHDSDFTGAIIDQDTKFENAQVNGCTIDRYALDTMTNFGGLSVGALMTMNIMDDAATLRQSFGGFWGRLHTLSVLVFAFPYAWFLFNRWQEASFVEDPNVPTISILEALARYIFNGGINWRIGYDFDGTFLIFILALALNSLRIVLLIKVKQLERHLEVTGVPANFRLGEKSWVGLTWGTMAAFMNWASTIFLLITLLNTFHFFQMGVPI